MCRMLLNSLLIRCFGTLGSREGAIHAGFHASQKKIPVNFPVLRELCFGGKPKRARRAVVQRRLGTMQSHMRNTAGKSLFCISLLTLTFASITALAEEPWSKRMADAVMSRWPDGQIVRGGDKIGDWAYDKNILFASFTN